MSYIGITPEDNIYPFISKIPDSSYPENIKKEIKLISFSKDTYTTPFGSFVYKVQKYPGDIDLLDTYIDCCDRETVILGFEKILKRIVKNILKLRYHYYSEIKTGLDKRYQIETGNYNNGQFYVASNLKELVLDYYENGLFNDEEYNILVCVLGKGDIISSDDGDVINTIFRERLILRWTPKEILKGEKILPLGKKIKLTTALSMKTPVKLDEIVYINNRFIEVTNFVMLAYVDEEQLVPITHISSKEAEKLHPVNLTFNLLDKSKLNEHAIKELPFEIEKLYFSNIYYSPFKMIKRIYARARQIPDNIMLQKIIPVISSNISLLYQIKSELDTIVLILERVKNPPKISINKSLDEMKLRWARVVEFENEDLDYLNNLIDQAINSNNKKKIEILKDIKKKLLTIINFYSIKYLQEQGLNPPPRDYLPKQLKYKYRERNSFSEPINPLKEYIKDYTKGKRCDIYPEEFTFLPEDKIKKKVRFSKGTKGAAQYQTTNDLIEAANRIKAAHIVTPDELIYLKDLTALHPIQATSQEQRESMILDKYRQEQKERMILDKYRSELAKYNGGWATFPTSQSPNTGFIGYGCENYPYCKMNK